MYVAPVLAWSKAGREKQQRHLPWKGISCSNPCPSLWLLLPATKPGWCQLPAAATICHGRKEADAQRLWQLCAHWAHQASPVARSRLVGAAGLGSAAPDHLQDHAQLCEVATKLRSLGRVLFLTSWETTGLKASPSLVHTTSPRLGPGCSSFQPTSSQFSRHLCTSEATSTLWGLFRNIYESSHFSKPLGWRVPVSAWTRKPRRLSPVVSQEGEGDNFMRCVSQAKQMKPHCIIQERHLNFHEKLETKNWILKTTVCTTAFYWSSYRKQPWVRAVGKPNTHSTHHPSPFSKCNYDNIGDMKRQWVQHYTLVIKSWKYLWVWGEAAEQRRCSHLLGELKNAWGTKALKKSHWKQEHDFSFFKEKTQPLQYGWRNSAGFPTAQF